MPPRRLRGACAALAAALLLPAAGAAIAGGQAEGLMDIFEQAREADPQLRGQRFDVGEGRELQREAFGGLLPSINATAEVERVRREQTSSGFAGEEDITRQFTREQYSVTLTQPLFDLPAWRNLHSARSDVTSREYTLEAARQELIVRVTEAYLEALSAASQRTLAEREVEATESAFERVEGLYDEGLAAVTELEEIRARRDGARAAVLRAQSDYDRALEALSELTGNRHYTLRAMGEDATLPDIDPDDPDAWLQRARQSNPEVLAARASVESVRHEFQSARAERYPRLDLTAGYSRFDELDGTQFGRVFDDLSAGVRLTMPLSQGGQIYARARGVQQRRARQDEQLEATRRDVEARVRGAYSALMSARHEIEAQQLAVASNERNVEAMEAEVAAGERPVVDLVDAQRDLFGEQRELAQLRHQYLIDSLALKEGAGLLGPDDLRALDALFSGRPTARVD